MSNVWYAIKTKPNQGFFFVLMAFQLFLGLCNSKAIILEE